MRQPHKDTMIEAELRKFCKHYEMCRSTDDLEVAITIRTDLGKYFIEHREDILRMVHGYNAPLGEPEDDHIPF